jgi:hypothetical protein
MTINDVFDKVVEHMLKQNQRAVDKDNRCMYKTEDGLKCAVGCLINDTNYSTTLEHQSIRSIEAALKLSGVPVESSRVLRLLEDLQEVHDHTDPNMWYFALKGVAQQHDLFCKHLSNDVTV